MGYWEVRGETGDGLKGIAKGTKPVDLEWHLKPLFFLSLQVVEGKEKGWKFKVVSGGEGRRGRG